MKLSVKEMRVIAKYSGLLMLAGFVLSIAGLNTPWVFNLSVQVWLAAMVTGVVCFATGLNWNDGLGIAKKKNDLLQMLTQREKQVADLVLEGKSNKEICQALFIGENTLKTHIRNIYRKANCTTRDEFASIFR